MAEYVFQHFVPQFYLKQFADQSGTIHCYRKPDGNRFPIGKDNIRIAGRKEFYDDSDEKMLEKGLSMLEGLHSQAYYKLIDKTNPRDLPESYRQGMVHFVTFQYLRTKRQRDELLSPEYDPGNTGYEVKTEYLSGPSKSSVDPRSR